MNTRLFGLVAIATAFLASGPARAEGELHIYNWADYTSPELIEKFEKTYNVKVTVDGYDSNETMINKLRLGGTGYDIVVPSDYMIAIAIEEGFLAETKPNQMENFKNVDPRWYDVYWDPGLNYTVPWQWGTTSFSVNTAKYSGNFNTLAILFEPPQELCGRINMLLDMNAVLDAGLRYLDLPRCNSNPEDLKKLNDMLQNAKACWRSFAYETFEKLTSGDVDVSQNWSGYSARARIQDTPTIAYAYPKEGMSGFMDSVGVLKDAPNLENAKLFQNFIMLPENAALISNFAYYANGIVGGEAGMIPELIGAPEINPPEGAPEPEFVPPCSQEVTQMYDRIWTKLLN